MIRTVATLPLLALGCSAAAPSVAQESTWAFVPKGAPAASPLDLSFLNKAPITGRVALTKDGEGFVDGAGKPLRFQAVLSDVYMKTPAEMERHIKFLARMGINMVRLHASIAPTKGEPIDGIDEKQVEGIRRFVPMARKAGIYCTMSPYWGHSHQAAKWGLEGYEKDDTNLYGLLFFEPRLQIAYRGWVKKLLTEPNPYADGVPLAKDPGLAIVQVQNEDSLLFWTTQAIAPPMKAKLAAKFGEWMKKTYGGFSRWDGAGQGGDDLANGRPVLLDHWMLTQDQPAGGLKNRADDQARFYAETQHAFYGDHKAWLRKECGYDGLTNATNWITADPSRLTDLERWSYTAMDISAVNRYYNGGAHEGANNGWRVDPGDKYSSASGTRLPRDLPTSLKTTKGQPMMVTETGWVWPLEYQSEGPLMNAIYSGVNGVDATFYFSMTDPDYQPSFYFDFLNFPRPGGGNQHATQKWSQSHPQGVGMMPAASLIQRLGLVKEAPPALVEERSLAAMFRREPPLFAEDKSFDPNRNGGAATEQTNVPGGVSPYAPLVGPVRAVYGGDPSRTKALGLGPYIEGPVIRSATGEVTLDRDLGRLILDAPAAQGVVGTPGTKPVKTRDATFLVRNSYANLVLVAMDGLPLGKSKKILVQFGGTARPTGWKTRAASVKTGDKTSEPGQEVVDTGDMPWRLSRAEATIILANPLLKKLTPLDADGKALAPTALKAENGRVRFAMPPESLWAILE